MKFEQVIYLLKTADSAEEIDGYRNEIESLIPKVRIMFDYDQKNHAHQFDLWWHCLHTVFNLPRNLSDDMVYLAALLHDIGKPDSQCRGRREGDTNMHYYGHQARSLEIVRDIIIPDLMEKKIELTEKEIKRLLYYVEYHDDRVNLQIEHIIRHLQIAEFWEFQNLMLLQVADAKAHVQLPKIAGRVKMCNMLAGEYGSELYIKILEGEQ